MMLWNNKPGQNWPNNGSFKADRPAVRPGREQDLTQPQRPECLGSRVSRVPDRNVKVPFRNISPLNVLKTHQNSHRSVSIFAVPVLAFLPVTASLYLLDCLLSSGPAIIKR
ncbi:hypothetical protein EYF80_020945 [Liparis tanakae]|uniref:Uncharacterized protein n=1 Tax=Liparis tanakae TaxID=230148 RepID=A0A4Z2HTD0_9TELE|nr:hypothetical protein EYF80_020945 [Liparis tanakae]